MRKIAASLLAAVALLLGAAPAAAQGQVFPQTLPDHTVLGRIGSGTGSGPAQAIPFANLAGTLGAQAPGVVTVVRPPGTYTGENAVWVAKSPDGVALCTPAVDATACLNAAIAAAHPYAIGTPLLGYSLNVIGGLDPALSPTNHAGASALLSFSGPLVFPPVNTGSIISRDVSWSGTLQFDSFGTGSLLFEGGQILPSVCASCVSVDFRPTNTPVANGGFIGMGPLYAHFTAVNGQFHFADWSGTPAGANAINSVEVKIDELEFAGGTFGCAVLIDSPLIGSQNFTENRLQVMALNNLGSGSTGLCIGTQAPAGGAAFGRNYYDVTIEPDNGGTAKGVDTWASGDELHIKTWQFGTGAVLTFESGACKNVAYIFSDLASPTITDNSGCTGNNANIWFVNGKIVIGGQPVVTNIWSAAYPSTTGNGQLGLGASSTNGGLVGGVGSSFDFSIVNSLTNFVCQVATATTTLSCVGLKIGTNPVVAQTAGNFTTGNFLKATGTTTIGDAGYNVVPVGNGGTGQTSPTAHGVVLGEGGAALNVTAAGTAGFSLYGAGASTDPIFAQCLQNDQYFTSGTSLTYTTPTCTINGQSVRAAILDVELAGGGAGGNGGGGGGTGTDGNSTSFGTFTAGGGLHGGGTAGACTGSPTFALSGGTGGAGMAAATTTNDIGGPGGMTPVVGVPVFGIVNGVGPSAPVNSGSGGAGGGATASAGAGAGGSAGAYCRTYITTPAASYTYTVAATATFGAAGTNGQNGGVGASGLIHVRAKWQ